MGGEEREKKALREKQELGGPRRKKLKEREPQPPASQPASLSHQSTREGRMEKRVRVVLFFCHSKLCLSVSGLHRSAITTPNNLARSLLHSRDVSRVEFIDERHIDHVPL